MPSAMYVQKHSKLAGQVNKIVVLYFREIHESNTFLHITFWWLQTNERPPRSLYRESKFAEGG